MTDSGSLHEQGAPGLGADKAALRRRLIAYRTSMPDREERLDRLLAVVGAWLAVRTETVIGGYWPFRGEPDLLPFLGSWMSGPAGRSVGLPVIAGDTSSVPEVVGEAGVLVPPRDVRVRQRAAAGGQRGLLVDRRRHAARVRGTGGRSILRRVRLDHGPQRQLLQVPELRVDERV